jgi:hypothetical protein
MRPESLAFKNAGRTSAVKHKAKTKHTYPDFNSRDGNVRHPFPCLLRRLEGYQYIPQGGRRGNFHPPRPSCFSADPRRTAVHSRLCQAAGGLWPLEVLASSPTLLQPSWADRGRLEPPSTQVPKLTPLTEDADSLGGVTAAMSSLGGDLSGGVTAAMLLLGGDLSGGVTAAMSSLGGDLSGTETSLGVLLRPALPPVD